MLPVLILHVESPRWHWGRRAQLFLHRVNTNRKATRMNNLPCQADLVEVSETGDQPFVVVPLLGVNTNRKAAQMNNLPHQADLLKV